MSSSASFIDFIVSSSSSMLRVSMTSSSRFPTFESRARSSSVKRVVLLGMGSPSVYLAILYFNVSILLMREEDSAKKRCQYTLLRLRSLSLFP